VPKVSDLTRFVNALAERREPFVMATVVRVHGSTIGKPGFKAVVSKEGRILFGTVGGVCPESVIATIAMESLRTAKARVVKVYLEDARNALDGTLKNKNPDEIYVETKCGGMMEIYVDPYLPTDRLIMVGQGGKDDIEDGLVRFGKILGYETIVIDHLPVLQEDPDTLVSDLDYDLNSFQFSPTDSVVVLTKGERDIKTLETLSGKGVRFVGMVASRQRTADDLEELRRRGVPAAFIESIHAPIGIDIGAVSAEEIALSIMADVTATKHNKHLPHKPLAGEALNSPKE
jgi:xanthine dehydrogenase accessory factor